MEKLAVEEINGDVVIKHLKQTQSAKRVTGRQEVTTLYPPSLPFPSCFLNMFNNDTYYGLLSRFLHGRGRHQYVERGGGESQGTSQRYYPSM
jgi:hypothetical protein